MSALARYFKAKGCDVCGFDRTETPLTKNLVAEGIGVHYNDDAGAIPQSFKDNKNDTLVVYTPAIPVSNSELQWFKNQNYLMMKRSEALGLISKSKHTIAVAGTHGKTSVSTMVAHLVTATGIGCDAFLGGISKNYNSNLLLAEGSRYVVAEADEYDRSFLRLHPHIALVTSMDADHLDIYGTHNALKEAFEQFASQITCGGTLIIKYGLTLPVRDDVRVFTYSLNDANADFHAKNIRMEKDGRYLFTLQTPNETIENVHTLAPGLLNVENGIAAMAATIVAGGKFSDCEQTEKIETEKIKDGLASFEGILRRFDFRIRKENIVYIDDYAHHPEELRFAIKSVRELYPGKHITGIFQPHLYTRTRDFAGDFAQSLDLLDSILLLDIYPAREEPIEGITSEIIFKKITVDDKILCKKSDVINILKNKKLEVLLTLGAGDIDTLVAKIEQIF